MAATELAHKTERLQSIRLRDNLISLMQTKATNMTHIHRKTGVPITTIQRICKDANANPTLASLMPIADFFSITVAQLIGEEPLPDASHQWNTQKWANIPIISWQQAINWPQVSAATCQQARQTTTEINISNRAFALEIFDDHHDNFQKGSLLIIDPELTAAHRDYVISHKKSSKEASLKQILIHEEDIYLKPTNLEFKTTLMNDNHRILGVVAQVKMNLK